MRLIDADHLKSWILSRVFKTQLNLADVIDQIDREDTIEPGRKTGKWIYGEHDVTMCDGYWCDKCGFFVPWDYKHKSIDFINDYHFCPSCGTKMEDNR